VELKKVSKGKADRENLNFVVDTLMGMSTPYEKTQRNKICERTGLQLSEFGIGACIPDQKNIGNWIFKGLQNKLITCPSFAIDQGL
jgi:hypothetical protein